MDEVIPRFFQKFSGDANKDAESRISPLISEAAQEKVDEFHKKYNLTKEVEGSGGTQQPHRKLPVMAPCKL